MRKPAKKGASVTQMPGTNRIKATPPKATEPPKTNDPPPSIIDLLRRVKALPKAASAEREGLLAAVDIILTTWDERGDLDELRALLGVKAKRKRKLSL